MLTGVQFIVCKYLIICHLLRDPVQDSTPIKYCRHILYKCLTDIEGFRWITNIQNHVQCTSTLLFTKCLCGTISQIVCIVHKLISSLLRVKCQRYTQWPACSRIAQSTNSILDRRIYQREWKKRRAIIIFMGFGESFVLKQIGFFCVLMHSRFFQKFSLLLVFGDRFRLYNNCCSIWFPPKKSKQKNYQT